MDGENDGLLDNNSEPMVDVTRLFEEAAKDIEPDSLIFMEGFTLQDAMSACEIGEPRLDSGAVLEGERRPPFNPLNVLLPEEICWIMDTSFNCEMEWHAGNTLSQTIFTNLYCHHLQDLNPDLYPLWSSINDNCRPFQLIVMVLRAFTIGLLKSCDLSWRELSKDSVHDGEDWQGEKCDVSLLEGVTVTWTAKQLDDALAWLQNSSQVIHPWKQALQDRLLLRKFILQLMNMSIGRDSTRFQMQVRAALELLSRIRLSQPPPKPADGSPADLAFDPHIARQLNSFLPLRPLVLPSQEVCWAAVESLFKGWLQLTWLSTTNIIVTWEIRLTLNLWFPKMREQIPYLRSLTQSTFYDGVLVMNRFPLTWVVERFFLETVGISREKFVRSVNERWATPGPAPIAEIERQLIKLMIAHIRSHCYNAPRRRRYLMKSIVDIHALYSSFLQLTRGLTAPLSGSADVLVRLPEVLLIWKLTAIREIVLSGFQLDLYTADERPFAYWYAAQVMEIHLCCLDNVMKVVSKVTPVYAELSYQQLFLSAFQIMSFAMFTVSLQSMSLPPERLRMNFLRRYKWAFTSEVEDHNVPNPGLPDFSAFLDACTEMLDEGTYSPSDSFKLAKDILLRLMRSRPAGWAGRWVDDRYAVVRSLIDVCQNLSVLPTGVKEFRHFDLKRLHWKSTKNPWFPIL